MKKKILFLLLSFVLLSSCKVTHEILSGQKFDKRIGDAELSRVSEENCYPFTLDCELFYGCPIVNYVLNGRETRFLLDTGSKYNGITNQGLEKLGYNIYDFQVSLLPVYIKSNKMDANLLLEIKNNNTTVIDKLLKQMIKSFDYGNAYLVTLNGIQWGYGRMIDSELDGILGQAFLKENKIVTLDFINNVMILNNEKIQKNIIKMEWNDFSHLVISFNYKDYVESAIIDTGNYSFTPRYNLGKNRAKYNIDPSNITSQTFIRNFKEKRVFPIIHTYNDISIGEEEFNNIRGVYANVFFSGYDKNVRILLLDNSSIGCALLNNHILQLDYEHMEMSLTK